MAVVYFSFPLKLYLVFIETQSLFWFWSMWKSDKYNVISDLGWKLFHTKPCFIWQQVKHPLTRKMVPPTNPLYRVLFLRKMCFNWLNQVDSKDLFQLNWLKGKISKYIFLLYEEINEVDLKTTLVIIGNHASWWAKSNNPLANNNILVLELSLAAINRVFSIPVRV